MGEEARSRSTRLTSLCAQTCVFSSQTIRFYTQRKHHVLCDPHRRTSDFFRKKSHELPFRKAHKGKVSSSTSFSSHKHKWANNRGELGAGSNDFTNYFQKTWLQAIEKCILSQLFSGFPVEHTAWNNEHPGLFFLLFHVGWMSRVVWLCMYVNVWGLGLRAGNETWKITFFGKIDLFFPRLFIKI